MAAPRPGSSFSMRGDLNDPDPFCPIGTIAVPVIDYLSWPFPTPFHSPSIRFSRHPPHPRETELLRRGG